VFLSFVYLGPSDTISFFSAAQGTIDGSPLHCTVGSYVIQLASSICNIVLYCLVVIFEVCRLFALFNSTFYPVKSWFCCSHYH